MSLSGAEVKEVTRRKDDFEVLVDIPGLTLVRVDGKMHVDVVPGFRTRDQANRDSKRVWRRALAR